LRVATAHLLGFLCASIGRVIVQPTPPLPFFRQRKPERSSQLRAAGSEIAGRPSKAVAIIGVVAAHDVGSLMHLGH